jgi:hypothetical protein
VFDEVRRSKVCVDQFKRLLTLVLVAPLWLAIVTLRVAIAQQIWFGPPYRFSPDYMGLFEPGAPWQTAASHVAVFELKGRFAIAGSNVDLVRIINNLQQRHIGLLVGIAALWGTGPGRCGRGVEGYNARGQAHSVALRIKRLGGVPTYFGMDEPLYYGHLYSGRNGCRASIMEIAHQAGETVRQVHTVFPDAKFGDVEPFGIPDSGWLADLGKWFDAFEQASGQKLAYFGLDVAWQRNWQAQLPPLVALLRHKGIPLQVIYNSSGRDQSDEEAVAHTTAHFKAFEAALGSAPAIVSFQSWVRHPQRVLPESDPRTLTGLINQYIAWRQSRH